MSDNNNKACCPFNIRNVAIGALVAAGLIFSARRMGWVKGFGGQNAKSANPYTSGDSTTSNSATAPVAIANINAIVISGPSGVGKGTLIDRIKKENPTSFAVSVSHTTRAPRAGEVDGQHYHFSTKEKMTEMDKNGEFLELCNVHGNLYGTSIAALNAVRESGKVCIIEVDVQGSQKIKKALAASGSDLRVAYMFISAPSIEELEARITKRGGEDLAKVKTRLETAKSEIKFLEDCPSHFDFVLVNDDLEKAYGKFKDFMKSKGALKA